MRTAFCARYLQQHSSHLLHLSSPRDSQQGCRHPALVARYLWMMLSVKGTFSGASVIRTNENNHDPCPIPSPLLPKAVVSLDVFGTSLLFCHPLCKWQPVLGGLEVSQCLSAGVCGLVAHLPGWSTWQQKGLSLSCMVPSSQNSSYELPCWGRALCLFMKLWGCFYLPYLIATLCSLDKEMFKECSTLGSVEGQVGQGLQQPDLVEYVPAHGIGS